MISKIQPLNYNMIWLLWSFAQVIYPHILNPVDANHMAGFELLKISHELGAGQSALPLVQVKHHKIRAPQVTQGKVQTNRDRRTVKEV
jgi:hypothetical protein